MHNSARGFSLVEVIFATGIFGIVVLSMMSLILNQQKQILGLSQKQEMIELKTLIMRQISSGAICDSYLADKTVDVSMSPSASAPSPSVLNLDTLYHGAPGASEILAKAGQPVPGTNSRLNVESILFKGVYATGNPDEYRGFFQINFDRGTLAYPMKPVEIQQIFSTVTGDPTSAKRIKSCLGASQMNVRCVIAKKEGTSAGAVIVHDGAPPIEPIANVFDVFEYTGAETKWGLACKAPYLPTTCTAADLGLESPPVKGADVWSLDDSGRPGCFSDGEEMGGGGVPRVFLTCCRFSAN